MILEVVSRTQSGGKKEVNEDRLLIREVSPDEILLLIADGLGGHPGGDVASSLVVDSITAQQMTPPQDNLKDMLIKASETIIDYGANHPEVDGMGSTATLALIQQMGVRWVHLGDGRLYHYHNNKLLCRTRDQTLARKLFDLGEISRQEIGGHKLNHFLEQCLGEEDIVPDNGSFECKPDDILLLSTDGLHNMVPDSAIQNIIADNCSLEVKADQLLAEAVQAGGKDDITFILCSFNS